MEAGSIVLRAALGGDLLALQELAHEGNLTLPDGGDFHRSDRFVLVADRAGAIAGFGVLQLAADEAEILDLAVSSTWRRRGLGRRLLDQLLVEARARGATRVFLEVRRDNVAAVALYRRVGFVQVGERLRYYRDGQDAILLGLHWETDS